MIFAVDSIPPDEAHMLFVLKSAFVAAGWLIPTSGNGSAFAAYNLGGGDVITSAADLAYCDSAVADRGSWFVAKQPAIASGHPGYPGGREFLFYRAISSGIASGGVRYARYDTAGYVSGGSAVHRPNNATHDVIASNNSIVNFNAGIFGNQQPIAIRQQCLVQDAPPYAWANVCWNNGIPGGTISALTPYILLFDFLSPAIAEDPEPYVFCNPNNLSNNAPYNLEIISQNGRAVSNTWGKTWYGAGLGSEQWNTVIGTLWSQSGNQLASPRRTGPNPFTAADEEMPVFWTGDTTLTGLRHPKGTGTMMRWSGTQRADGTTYNNKTRIQVGDVSFDFDGATVPYI